MLCSYMWHCLVRTKVTAGSCLDKTSAVGKYPTSKAVGDVKFYI